MKRLAVLLASLAACAASAEDTDLGRIALIDDLQTTTQVVEKVTRSVIDQHHHDVAVTNVTLQSGEIVGGLVIQATNLVSVVPVINTTAVVQVTAPFAQGHYTPNRYSAIEIGDLWQALFTHRLQIGTAAYFPSPSKIRFTDGLTTNQYDACKTLQEYLDAADPTTVGELLHGYVPCVGDSAIDGSLRVTGTLASEGTLQITNANIIARKFSVVDGNLTAIGLTLTNGFCRLQAADIERGASSPRWHLKDDGRDPYGNALTNFTFGGSWQSPKGNIKSYIDTTINNKGENIKMQLEAEVEDIASTVIGGAIDRGPGGGTVWNAKNHRTALLDDSTFPNGGKFYFPHYVHTGEAALANPIHFDVVLNYAGEVPYTNFGVYAPDTDVGWRVLAPNPDVYVFSNGGHPVKLEFRQISTNTLTVTRQDFYIDKSPVGEGSNAFEN